MMCGTTGRNSSISAFARRHIWIMWRISKRFKLLTSFWIQRTSCKHHFAKPCGKVSDWLCWPVFKTVELVQPFFVTVVVWRIYNTLHSVFITCVCESVIKCEWGGVHILPCHDTQNEFPCRGDTVHFSLHISVTDIKQITNHTKPS